MRQCSKQYALTDFINEGTWNAIYAGCARSMTGGGQALVRALTLHFRRARRDHGRKRGHAFDSAFFKSSSVMKRSCRRAEQAGVGLVSARPYFLKSRWNNDLSSAMPA